MSFLPEWHRKEAPDTLETQRNRCTSTRPMQTADSRANATSPRNATCTNRWQFRSWTFRNHQFAGRTCVYTNISCLHWIFYSWSICPGSPSRYRFSSSYADWWKNIHWLVHYLLCGNAAHIHLEDQSSLLSEPASDDEHWSNGTGYWRLLYYIFIYY